jgi:hypothetical protein
MKQTIHFIALVSMTVACLPASAEKLKIKIGDSEEQVRRVYGRPSMTIEKGPDIILMYKAGEVTLREGKVVSNDMPGSKGVGIGDSESDPSRSSRTPAYSESKSMSRSTTRSPTTSDVSNKKKWDPGPVPDYPAFSRRIRKVAQDHNISAGQDALRESIDLAWVQHTQGAKSPFLSWKDQVRFRRLEKGMRLEFDIDDKAEYTGNIKFQSDGDWVYTRALPDARSGVRECWKKYSTRGYVGRTYSGVQATDHYMGTQSSWYKLTRDKRKKCWYWLPESERQAFIRDFRQQAQKRIQRAKQSSMPKPRNGYTTLEQVVHAHSIEFEVLAFEAFLNDLESISWPAP